MPDLKVDTTSLEQAAGALRAVGRALTPANPSGGPEAMGSPAGEAALSGFVAAWQLGTSTLFDLATSLGAQLARAASDYETVERRNAAAARRRR